jgi:hypothetical protein
MLHFELALWEVGCVHDFHELQAIVFDWMLKGKKCVRTIIIIIFDR